MIKTPPTIKGTAIFASNLFDMEFQIFSPLSEAFFFEKKTAVISDNKRTAKAIKMISPKS